MYLKKNIKTTLPINCFSLSPFAPSCRSSYLVLAIFMIIVNLGQCVIVNLQQFDEGNFGADVSIGKSVKIGQTVDIGQEVNVGVGIDGQNWNNSLPGNSLSCLTNEQCSALQTCQAGFCLPNKIKCGNMQCKATQSCIFGRCIKQNVQPIPIENKCGNKVCGSGFTCKFGFCVGK